MSSPAPQQPSDRDETIWSDSGPGAVIGVVTATVLGLTSGAFGPLLAAALVAAAGAGAAVLLLQEPMA